MPSKSATELMGIFKEMREQRQFESDWEYRELKRKLSEANSRGNVEQVSVMKPSRFFLSGDHRDNETGEIYSLVEPEEKIRGRWARVDPEDLVGPGQSVQ